MSSLKGIDTFNTIEFEYLCKFTHKPTIFTNVRMVECTNRLTGQISATNKKLSLYKQAPEKLLAYAYFKSN